MLRLPLAQVLPFENSFVTALCQDDTPFLFSFLLSFSLQPVYVYKKAFTQIKFLICEIYTILLL